ncbi:MAG: sorbosone dehydrogenase family protein [Leptothrix sp. (in: b-proteobacteria)]
MPSTRTAIARSVIGLVLVSLFACGGGGGDGGGPVNPPQAPVFSAPANFASGLGDVLTISVSAIGLAMDSMMDSGAAQIEIQVDGQPAGATGSGLSHSVTVDTSVYAAGQHILRARVRDAAGTASAWATETVHFGGGRTQPAGFTRSDLVSGLINASAFAQAPDGRYFVATQGGDLRIVSGTPTASVLATPFVSVAVDATDERGLIGVALHPDFAHTGWVYLYYTTTENGTHNRISRYTADSVNPNLAATGSELRIADLPPLSAATNHNGGGMHFGLDGKLYVGVGDNANGARAPDLSSVFGKLLRFNDDGSIPPDNPFCATAGVQACAIWARGLRNPFSFAVQPGSGRILIDDVGENTWEEIDLGAAAANYGWPATEGPTGAAGVSAPLFAYPHNAASPPGSGPGGFFSGCAIIGGAFYPDSGPFPAAYRGSYFFTDLCAALVGRIDLANDQAAYAFGQVAGSPVGMLIGLDGALDVLTQTAIVRFSAP